MVMQLLMGVRGGWGERESDRTAQGVRKYWDGFFFVGCGVEGCRGEDDDGTALD